VGVRWGLVDRPDGWRKVHARPTPVAGGLVLLGAAGGAAAVAFLVPSPLGTAMDEQALPLLGLLLGAAVICLVGLADDRGLLRGRHKLVGQLLAALVVVEFGVVVHSVRVFDVTIELGVLAVPLTVLWLLAAVNSLNLIDGMDGLLSCVGLLIALALATMALLDGKPEVACVALALAGALAGFLLYNFPPASIFLGDSGSMVIGLAVGVLAIEGARKAPATVALATPAALLTIPFFDTLAAIVRRKLTGRSIYTTDRGHLHHCLLRRGLPVRRVLLAVSVFCLLTLAGALVSQALNQEWLAFAVSLAVVASLVLTQTFGHAEFVLLRKHLVAFGLSLLRWRSPPATRLTEVRLQGSADWGQLWGVLIESAPRLNLTLLRLNVNAPSAYEGYHARWERPADEDVRCWRADLPLTAHGQTLGRLEVAGQRNGEPVCEKITLVLTLVADFESAAAGLLAPARPPRLDSAAGIAEPLRPVGRRQEIEVSIDN
jgi:UDP-GlcNAc:undecaprenyl-phosphate GlcNAc-1-phosphate transferase